MTYNTIEPIVSNNEGQLKDNEKDKEQDKRKDIEIESKEERKYIKDVNTPIWYENPALLFSSNSITELYPKENMSQEQKIML